MGFKSVLSLCVLSFLAGGGIIYKFNSRGEIIKTVDKIITQEVTKTVTVTTPGKTVTTTVVVENKKEDVVKTDVKPVPKLDYGLGLGIGTDGYTASISRRMVGDLWLEAGATSKGSLSVGIRYDF